MRFLLASYVLLAVFLRSRAAEVRGNEVFDQLLEELRDADEIRVMTLEDFKLGFERKVLMIPVRGEAKLFDGTVVGLDTAERIDDAVIVKHSNGNVEIMCTLSMGVIEFNYKGTVTFMDLGPEIKMQSHTGFLTVDVDILRAPDGSVKVTRFNVIDFEKLKVKFTGLGPLTWATNLLIAPAVKVLTPLARRTVEWRVRGIVERKLPDIIARFNFE